jgi:hypothetical protein
VATPIARLNELLTIGIPPDLELTVESLEKTSLFLPRIVVLETAEFGARAWVCARLP